MFYFDPLYLILTIPALLLGLWAQSRVKSAFEQYAQVGTRLTGARAARTLLDRYGLSNVRVERVDGFLSDHYNPLTRELRLSPTVYDGATVASVGVAAHEAGHALQHAQGYLPLQFRSAIVPGVVVGSWLGPMLFFVGFIFNSLRGLAWIGVAVFGLVALFSLVTLPVEFDASHRAKKLLVAEGILDTQEMTGVNAVLNAAALTYVAAAVQAVMNLLYYVILLTGGRRQD
ncbi:peptidase membrane zinc metallopeptidase putative [Gloeomargarita lithophora Alchichica-D10]|uniref:Peptidase membrane zinc metallopeptidase putative n=1 Tax=Gloeomargarita lithophora Alchichica-D10 TaxID=1188229 RepID=A0A1J0AD69_9CYAN|nr:zinc metallopeptidase [Gloeomargarita lithophora]APB33856.1 peptidase membrane zinc metallopeptidase putative [Gloeomargarita lithophora Alchichica-D10]